MQAVMTPDLRRFFSPGGRVAGFSKGGLVPDGILFNMTAIWRCRIGTIAQL
jgi:hypothetical protein